MTPVGIDAAGNVVNVLPAPFQPDVVAPGVWIPLRFDALNHNFLWISRSGDHIT